MKRRPFSHPVDLERLQDFASRCIRDYGSAGFLHPGDIPHRVYNALRREDPTQMVYIWEDTAGEIRAWTILDPRLAGFDAQLDHAIRDREPGFEIKLIDWAGQTLVAMMEERGSKSTHIATEVDESDTVRARVLESLGYLAQDTEVLMITRRALDEIAEPELPDGFTVRTVLGVEEAGPVSELHSAAFGSSWTPELYARVMTSPGYSQDREFLVVAPNGDLAAFCVTWPDEVNRTGLFEPVGVHPDYRRLGLGRVLLRAGMLAMREWGMEHASVAYETENLGSGSLYRSEGFVPIEKVVFYRKSLTSRGS